MRNIDPHKVLLLDVQSFLLQLQLLLLLLLRNLRKEDERQA